MKIYRRGVLPPHLDPAVFRPSPQRIAVFLLCLAVVPTLPLNLSRRDVTVTVEQAGIPEVCGSPWWRLGLPHRSSVPEFDAFDYCGALVTDHGAFEIVQTGSLFLGAEERAGIVERMQPGCRFAVSYFGLVASPQPGDRVAIGYRLPVIYRIRDEFGCAEEDDAGEALLEP